MIQPEVKETGGYPSSAPALSPAVPLAAAPSGATPSAAVPLVKPAGDDYSIDMESSYQLLDMLNKNEEDRREAGLPYYDDGATGAVQDLFIESSGASGYDDDATDSTGETSHRPSPKVNRDDFDASGDASDKPDWIGDTPYKSYGNNLDDDLDATEEETVKASGKSLKDDTGATGNRGGIALDSSQKLLDLINRGKHNKNKERGLKDDLSATANTDAIKKGAQQFLDLIKKGKGGNKKGNRPEDNFDHTKAEGPKLSGGIDLESSKKLLDLISKGKNKKSETDAVKSEYGDYSIY